MTGPQYEDPDGQSPMRISDPLPPSAQPPAVQPNGYGSSYPPPPANPAPPPAYGGGAPDPAPSYGQAYPPTTTYGEPPPPPPSPNPAPAPAGDLPPMRIPVGRPAQLVQPVRIGVWGSARSGKSAFLAATPLAALHGPHGQSWMVSGTNQAAADYLTAAMTRLVAGRQFPVATQVTTPISWQFSGPAPHAGPFALPEFMHRHARNPVEFVLELSDPPGRSFEAGQIDPQLVEILANATGILYLVDPLPSSADAFTSFYGTLQQLAARVTANRQMLRGKLPHFVAVCITKFDDETLFRRLVAETTLVTQDESVHWLPRIKPERTREYFDWVCERMLGGAANVVRDCLDTFFHRKRVAFFATSAIGFRLNPHRVFDFRDFRNVAIAANREPTVRDMPRPINVLEPLIYLERHIRAARRR